MQEGDGKGRERQTRGVGVGWGGGGSGSSANNRRFSEDSALGEMMRRMSFVSAPSNPSDTCI